MRVPVVADERAAEIDAIRRRVVPMRSGDRARAPTRWSGRNSRYVDVVRASPLPTLSALLLVCAAPPASSATPPPPSRTAASSRVAPPAATTLPAPARYAAVFDERVARIQRDHSSLRYARDVGPPWSDDVPRLRAEFAHATDPQEALIALRHLQNSLRDAHCDLSAPADLAERWNRIGLRVWAGGTTAVPEVRVSEVLDPDVKDKLAPGDSIVAIDGVPLAAWFAARPFESNMLAPRSALSDTSRAIVFAQLAWSTVKGEPLALDWGANDTFETRKTWVKDALEEARKRLEAGAKR